MSPANYSSEGFDLDAAASSSNDNVVYEIGGGVTSPQDAKEQVATNDDPLALANNYKLQGNTFFIEKNYLEAYDMYTEAINATPGMKAEELLDAENEWKNEQNRLMRQRIHERDERRRKGVKEEDDDGEEKQEKPPAFQVPHHPHAAELSVFHCNRAACLLHLQRYEEAVTDCNVAILWKPDYTKAYVRRTTAYEALQKTEDALVDAKKALALDPTNNTVKQMVRRLEKIEHERLEKLKAETMDKLKDLGNSILGNFGLSLDNFKAVKDPNTGSYSISFENGK